MSCPRCLHLDRERADLQAQVGALVRANNDANRLLAAVREQAAYGFTGETVKNMTEGMSAREMNGWWMKRLNELLGGKCV